MGINLYHIEKNKFCKMGCLRIIFFRRSNFREITTKIKTTCIPNIKITRNFKNCIKNYSICSKRIKEYF